MTSLARSVAVVGVGYSQLSRGEEADPRALTLEACLAAIEDSHIAAPDIDGIVQYSNPGESPPTSWVQRMLNIPNVNGYLELSSGPTGVGAGMAAITLVASGVCDTAIAYRTLSQRAGHNGVVASDPSEIGGPGQFTTVYGHSVAILANYALKKRLRIDELGGSAEDYGTIAINARRWAALNDRAVLRQPLTMHEYLSAPVIVDPLLRLDCDYPINGSCAIVVTTESRARDARRPVLVDSLAWGTGEGSDFNFGADFLYGASRVCADRLWSRSDFTPADVDVLALYDGFTHLPISWIEALGLCGVGEFGDWVDGGATIGPGGAFPLNTSGGMLAEGRVQGIGHIAEAVVQLRGEADGRQVRDAAVAVVAGGGSNDCGALILHA